MAKVNQRLTKTAKKMQNQPKDDAVVAQASSSKGGRGPKPKAKAAAKKKNQGSASTSKNVHIPATYGPMSLGSTKWVVKNLFELKSARRVLVDNNTFVNNCAHHVELEPLPPGRSLLDARASYVFADRIS